MGRYMDENEKLKIIVKALDGKKAENINVLKVSDLTILADYFVIADGTSNTHVKALAEEVDYQLSERGTEPSKRESDTGNTWMILDYSDIIVHIFRKDTRDFYKLDGLWADGESIDISEMLKEE